MKLLNISKKDVEKAKLFQKRIIVCIVFLLSLGIAYAAQPTMFSLSGYLTDANNNSISNANLTVLVSSTSSCSGDIFNQTYSVGGDSFDVLVGNQSDLNMAYNEDYYLCTLINNEQVGSARKFRGGQGEIESDDLADDINFTGTTGLNEAVLDDNNELKFGEGNSPLTLGADAKMYSDGKNLILQVESPAGIAGTTNPKIKFDWFDIHKSVEVLIPAIVFDNNWGKGVISNSLMIQDIYGQNDATLYLSDSNFPADNEYFQIRFDSGTNDAHISTAGSGAHIAFQTSEADAHIKIPQDNKRLYFGNGDPFYMEWDQTNQLFNTGSGIAYFTSNVSATGYITRTTAWNSENGNALDYIKDSSEYFENGKIKHENFAPNEYIEYDVTDYDNCWLEEQESEIKGLFNEEIMKNVTICPTKKEKGVMIDEAALATNRQAIYELKQENQMLKNELCLRDNSYSWCE